jgi:exoribonuclease-2
VLLTDQGINVQPTTLHRTLYPTTLSSPLLPVSLLENQTAGAIVPGTAHITPSLITPTHRLTYTDVDERLEECDASQEPLLHALARVAAARHALRCAAGAVDINMPETKLDVADPGAESPTVTVEVCDAGTSPSRQLVAEMMILAGEIAAAKGAELGVPLPYRGQNPPVLPSEEELAGVPEGPCRMALLRTCMTRSVTVADAPVRHAGLGLPGYVQVTSPIRRYGDLLAHWQLKAVLRGAPPPFATGTLTDELTALAATTQYVSKLEREASSYWVALFFKSVLAKDRSGGRWDATFLTWFKQEAGLGRVLLEGLGLETIVRVSRPAVPGTSFAVKCVSADPLLGMYRLEEASDV